MSDIDALNEFNAHVDELQEEYGIELSAEERRVLCGQSIQAGFTPESTVEAFSELVNEDSFDDDDEESDDVDELGPGAQRLVSDFNHDVGKLESALSRPLSDHEREHLVRSTAEQAARHGQIDLDGALKEYQAQFATESSRGEFYRQRLAPEPVEVDEGREFDMNVATDRHAFMQARIQGAEFEDAE